MHPASFKRFALALAGACCAVAGGAVPAYASAPEASSYGTVRHACDLPRPGRASCFALVLVHARAGQPDAVAYEPAAGARSKGPAGGLTPADLATAYGFAGASGGSGQTVAVVDSFNDPKAEADLSTFDAEYGLPACTSADGCFEKVGQTGSTGSLPRESESGWAIETALDIETVHGVCPKCKVLLVEANSESTEDLGAAVDEAVHLGAGEVSNSYGEAEGAAAPEAADYDHPGVVVAAAAGDWGYLEWDDIAEAMTPPEQPDAPASFPTVVAVGGTSLKLTSKGARKSETVWNNSGPPGKRGSFPKAKQFSATGGGCSTIFTAPSWQQDLSGWSATGCGSKRLDNDVSAVADPFTGFDIYDSDTAGGESGGGWMTVGGTSLSSPLVTAMYALAGGGQGVEYPAQTLYAHLGQSSALYDVTKGGDGYCDAQAERKCGEPAVNEQLGDVDCLGSTACDAAAGFDGPSGVGAPDGLGAFEPAG